MPNDTTINEMVEQAAAKHKEENPTGDTQNTKVNNEEGQGGDKEKDNAAAAELLKQNEGKPDHSEILSNLLKEAGVDSIEALKEKLAGKKEEKVLTAEEKEKQDAIYEAKLQQFAVENGEMKLDDFHQLKTLKSKQDAELVFENYLEDWKAENPEVTEDIEIAAKLDFEKEYKLNSENEKIKNKGVARLAKEAAEYRSPLESSYNKAKESFDRITEVSQTLPKFKESIKQMIDAAVPEKKEYFKAKDGDEEIPIELELTPEDRKEIQEKLTKKFETLENYYLSVKDGKEAEVKEALSDYAETLIERKLKAAGIEKVAATFFERGKSKGSNIGAKNSFATNQARQSVTDKTPKSREDAKREVLESLDKQKT